MINFFKKMFSGKKNTDLRFVDTTNLFYKRYPIVSAKSANSKLKEFQIKTSGKYNFQSCPGMYDYLRMGYVVNTFSDLYIKANKAGSHCSIGPSSTSNGSRLHVEKMIERTQTEALEKIGGKYNPEFPKWMGCTFNTMDAEIVDGLAVYEDDVPPNVWKLSLPWRIMGVNKKLSMLLMPPIYQNPEIFNYLYFYPGVIDYGSSFTTINVVFSIRKKCEFVIPAGQPILHLIPFITEQNINSTYGCSNFELNNHMHFLKYSGKNSFYRKHYTIKKNYNIKEHDSNENIIVDFSDINHNENKK